MIVVQIRNFIELGAAKEHIILNLITQNIYQHKV